MTDRDPLAVADAIFNGATSEPTIHPMDLGTSTTEVDLGGGLFWYEAFGNVTAIDTADGLLLIDATGPLHAGAVHERIRHRTSARLNTAVFTHGHVDHIYAVKLFEGEDGAEPARVVAHEALAARFRRYELTHGYNARINQRQFQLQQPYFPEGYRYPDVTFGDTTTLDVGGTTVELFHDRGETDDGTWVWWPERRVLCTGDLVIWASPNCGNPQKAQRYCDEWAAALRKMQALRPEVLLPGHGLPVVGADRVATVLSDAAQLLETIFEQTISMMNDGAALDEIVHGVRYPADLLDRPWLAPVYDDPEFIVRNIWRLYGGWYDGNAANLKPPTDDSVATEVAALAGGALALATRALELSSAGESRLATTLIEWAGRAAPTDPEVHAIRARVFADRAATETSLMAKGVYSWAGNQSRNTAVHPTPVSGSVDPDPNGVDDTDPTTRRKDAP